VKSQVGVGSTFSITIPQGPIDEASETGDSDAPQFTPTPVLKPSVGRGTGKLVMPSGYGGTAMPDTPGLSLPGSNGGDAPDEASLPPSPPPGSVLGTETTQLPMVPQKKKTSSHRRITYSRKQVLLIADEPELVNQVRRSIVNEGFEITNADNPFIAEAMVGGLLPTLIVMDVNFSSGGGWDLLRRLKERDDTFAIPFVIMSKLPEDAARAYDMGARTFVAIPFHPQTMLDAVLDAEHESSTERILIIDDQPEHVRLLTQLLDRHGNYRVFSAPNGKEGIALVARRRPDLIILDLRMPEMDGFAVLAELRNNFETASIPVIVVTGDVVGGDEAAALEGVHVMHKTDISQEEFDRFISDVKSHLSGGM
jgi:CheY-like chemotaxis protein